VVAGALRTFAVLFVVGAVCGVALFRAELLTLVPFVGSTGMAPPAIFTALVAGIALLFWALADGLTMLVDLRAAQARIEKALAELPVRRAPAPPAPKKDGSAAAGEVPGFKRYQRPVEREMKWTANVTNGPAYLAEPVCEVAKGQIVTAIGEVAEFTFVETADGSGWLPKDSLAA
jgi:hypothetical protein